MTKYSLTLVSIFLSTALMQSQAYASGFSCADSSGELLYSEGHSDGGPCCGSSGSSLSYKGQVIKSTNYRGGFNGPGSQMDTNPNLTVTEGQRVDLGNNSKPKFHLISHFAVNITLTTKDNSAPYAGQTSPAVVSLVCTNDQYDGPPIP